MKLAGLGPGGAPVLGESPRSLLYVTFPRRPRPEAASPSLTLRDGGCPVTSIHLLLLPSAPRARGPLRAGAREVEKLRAKCHYYCSRSPASMPAVSWPTENRGIRVTPSTSPGPKAAVVLSGVPGLVVNLMFVECTDCETLPFLLLLASHRFVLQKAD